MADDTGNVPEVIGSGVRQWSGLVSITDSGGGNIFTGTAGELIFGNPAAQQPAVMFGDLTVEGVPGTAAVTAGVTQIGDSFAFTSGANIASASPVHIGTTSSGQTVGLWVGNNEIVKLAVGPSPFGPQMSTSNDTGTLLPVGFREHTPNVITSSYTIKMADRGQTIVANASGITISIPNDAEIPMPLGTTIEILCNVGPNCSIQCIGTDKLIFSPSGAVGPRVLSPFGFCTIWKGAVGFWYIRGDSSLT